MFLNHLDYHNIFVLNQFIVKIRYYWFEVQYAGSTHF